MFSAHITIFLLLMGKLIFDVRGENMLGPGLWRVLKVEKCKGQYKLDADVTMRKISRTQAGFNVDLTLEEELNDSYGVDIEICKYVDGGCKPYQHLADESLPRFVQKYAADNVRAYLTLAGLDPPDFPVPQGSYEVRDFVLNYAELPPEAIYGSFGVEATVLKFGERIGCLLLDADFFKVDEDEEER